MNAPIPSASDRNPDLPSTVDDVFYKALAKDPDARYATCAEFVADLRNALRAAAGRTRIAAAPTAPIAAATPVARQRLPLWLPLLGGLLLAAVAGVIVALALSSGGGSPDVTTVIQEKTLPGTTVHQTVTTQVQPTTQQTTQAGPTPENAHALNDRAFELMGQGAYEQALPLLQQAVQRLQGAGPDDPYEGYANYNLGYTLVQVGRCDEAMSYLENADRLEPHNHDVRNAIKQAKHC